MTLFSSAVLVGATLFLGATSNPNPWDEVDDSDGIRVWAREVPNSKIREVKAEAILNLPATRVWEVLMKVEDYVEFMPYLIEGGVIGQATPNSQYEYQLLDPPLVSKRDYTLKIILEEDANKGIFRRSWEPANDKGPPPKKGVVRVEICEGIWTVEKLGSQSTRLEYWLYTDPGGSIPAWIANKANTVSVPSLLDAVRKRAMNPNWKKD